MTMRMKILMALLLISSVPACTLGKNAGGWTVAKRPEGAMVEVVTRNGQLTAELLDVAENGVVVMRSDGKLVFAPYSVIQSLRARQQGSGYRFGSRMPPPPKTRENLMTVSHFPQGMTSEIRARLLSRANQTEPLVLQ
jgi:hypothetical protein